MFRLLTNFFFVLFTLLPGSTMAAESLKYPDTKRGDQVDSYHGELVADPYRWLESDVRESPEVAEWVEEQSKFARAYLDAIPQRHAIQKRLTELWNYPRYSTPFTKAGKYFYFKNDGLQNQAVLYVADSPTSEGSILLDPNTWSADGTIALSGLSISDDGKYLAYSRSEAGSDWQQIFVFDVESGEQLSDHLQWSRFGGMAWNKAGDGFFYSRYPEPPEGAKHQTSALNKMIYFHKLGDDQSKDRLIYRRPDHPDWGFYISPTDDGEYLVLSLKQGTDPQNQVFVRKANAPDEAEWTEMIGDFENQFSFVGNDGERFYFVTDYEAPAKRLVAMELSRPGKQELIEIVPQQNGTLRDASFLSDKFILQYLEDVRPRVRVFDDKGKSLGEVDLPGYGSVSGFGGDQDDTETFYSFSSYNAPSTIYRYDIETGKSELVRRPELNFDPEAFTVEQVFYQSKDGTRVPMTLAFRADLDRSKPQPTLLYAYGGFNISILPDYSPAYIAWMEMGGILAVPNLRGGGEYGEEWHVAGKLDRKQNVFDDFISAAEWLIEEGYTTREKLAIMGGSNGGLLVGAVEVQRPELFGATIPMVGVMDMLRFHKFTAGQFWRDEYGSADDADQFKALRAYSPYHNIEPGTAYPPTLVMTADTDDRVVPMHSFKFAAEMQRAQAGPAPILLRVELRAGHGAGAPVTKQIDMAADRWAFLAKELKMDMAE